MGSLSVSSSAHEHLLSSLNVSKLILVRFKGCYQRVYAMLNRHLNPVMICLIVLVTIEIVAVIFALCLCKAVEREMQSRK